MTKEDNSGRMHFSCGACIVAASVLLSACTNRPSTEADTAAVRALIEKMERANNDGDVEAWVGSFDDPAWYLPAFGEAVTTQAGLREIAELGFSSWRSTISIEPKSIRVHQDWADAYSEVRGISVSPSGEDTVAVNVKQLAVYRRTGDGWRISRMIINTNE